MIQLTELQEDCLKEVFNIGIGRAAESLGTIFQEEVLLSIPRVITVHASKAGEELEIADPNKLCSVSQSFQGKDINAGLNLLFTEENSLELVRSFLGRDTALEEMTDLEDDALMEIGNIILNSFVGSVANLLQTEFESSLPTIHKSLPETISSFQNPNPEKAVIIAAYVEFRVISKKIAGLLLLTIDSGKLEEFVNRLIQSMV